MIRWFQLHLVVLAVSPLLAGTAGAADVYLDLTAEGKGPYKVDGQFWTPASPREAWKVLSNYADLPTFVPSLKTSTVQEKDSAHLLVRQEAVAHTLGLLRKRIHVLLDITEQPFHQINFIDTSKSDFECYKGYWKIIPAGGGGSWVWYHLEAKPLFYAPVFIARKSFRDNASALMMAVQMEVLRRSHLDDTQLCCSQ